MYQCHRSGKERPTIHHSNRTRQRTYYDPSQSESDIESKGDSLGDGELSGGEADRDGKGVPFSVSESHDNGGEDIDKEGIHPESPSKSRRGHPRVHFEDKPKPGIKRIPYTFKEKDPLGSKPKRWKTKRNSDQIRNTVAKRKD